MKTPTNLSSYCFILYEYSNDTDLSVDIHSELEDTLLKNFKLFNTSLVEATDYSSGEVFDGISYEVIMESLRLNEEKLINIIKKYAGVLEQDNVYFKKPTGEVSYLSVNN